MLFPLAKPERPISGNGGSAFPTSQAVDAQGNGGPPNTSSNTTRWGTARFLGRMAKQGQRPTPRASDGQKGGSPQNDNLAAEVKRWPTPTVSGNNNRKGVSPESGDGLATPAKTWPTPQAHDAKEGNPARVGRTGGGGHRNLNDEAALFPTPGALDADRASTVCPLGDRALLGAAKFEFPTPTARDRMSRGPTEMDRKSPGLSTLVRYPTPRANKWGAPDSHGRVPEELTGGLLNPRWVEWLMGIPIGWTRLEPLETESYLRWWLSFCGD